MKKDIKYKLKKFDNGANQVFDLYAQPDYSDVYNIKRQKEKEQANRDAIIGSSVQLASTIASSVGKGKGGKIPTNQSFQGVDTFKPIKMPYKTNNYAYNSAKKGKYKLKAKYEDGTEEVDVGLATGKKALERAGQGASLGAAAGPYGALIGGAVGAIGGTVEGFVANKDINKKIREAKINAQIIAKRERTNASVQGYDETFNQTIAKGSKSMKAYKCKNGSKKLSYKKGVRIIETEGREPIFSPKKKDGTRDLIYHNPKDPTHSKGGVPAAVVKNTKVKGILNIPEGSSIVTANDKMNEKAMKAYKKKDYKTLDKVINQMPEDKFKRGSKDLNTLKARKPYRLKTNLKANTDASDKYKSTLDEIEITPDKKSTEKLSKKGKNSLGYVEDLMPLLTSVKASSINNIIQGSKNPRKTTLNVPTLQLEQYIDKSEPNRKAASTLAKIKESNAARVSAGNAQNYLSNAQQAAADNYSQQKDINSEEADRSTEVANRNIERKNQQSQIQAATKNQEIAINQQDADANQSRLQTGLNELDEGIYRGTQDFANRKSQRKENELFDEVNDRTYQLRKEELKAYKKANGVKKKGVNKLKTYKLK